MSLKFIKKNVIIICNSCLRIKEKDKLKVRPSKRIKTRNHLSFRQRWVNFHSNIEKKASSFLLRVEKVSCKCRLIKIMSLMNCLLFKKSIKRLTTNFCLKDTNTLAIDSWRSWNKMSLNLNRRFSFVWLIIYKNIFSVFVWALVKCNNSIILPKDQRFSTPFQIYSQD